MELDFYDEVALKLIGLEIQISKIKKPTLQKGFTIGKMIVSRSLLKKLNIMTKLELESLRDALCERDYCLLEYSPVENFILINTRILRSQSVTVEQENIDSLIRVSMSTANDYFCEREKLDKENQQ